ncbi:protein PRQFV-amide-like [Mya arenaria]|uniref:protein PRQFV-amide-like n=1 Tax=Mya arenaria TaxID=6604 RepID=UPI0022E5D37B|nr:protein PRQFV-amide-like [Mya arenaria]
MRLRQAMYIFVLFYASLVFSILAEETFSKNDDNERNKRDLSDFDANNLVKEKRQRDFIGKRMRDFVGKRSVEDDGYALDLSGAADDYGDVDKRYRDFLGKRNYPDKIESEKRMRDFLGKRDFEYLDTDDLTAGEMPPYTESFEDERGTHSYEKRMRDFVGKRAYGGDVSYLVKRLRDFVGKRFTPEDIMMLRSRYFVRKPKYERELIGKRSTPLYVSDIQEDKRMRDFLGKRMRDFVGKRMRDFLG